jgi:hypothetical protein
VRTPPFSAQNDTVTNTLWPLPIPSYSHRNDPTAVIMLVAVAASWLDSCRI